MKRTWTLLAIVVVVAASLGAYVGLTGGVDARAQDCEEWTVDTFDRVNDARTLLYDPEREDAFQGSDLERADGLLALADEQLGIDPPDNARQLDGDLLEAFQAGAAGYEAGGVEGATLIYFAKSIVYNADARLVTLLNSEGC